MYSPLPFRLRQHRAVVLEKCCVSLPLAVAVLWENQNSEKDNTGIIRCAAISDGK